MNIPALHHRSASRDEFTLIELLIVVAIIAILAAIAVPNFLEAQTRAKCSRTASDLRTLTTAIQTYIIDASRPPAYGHPFDHLEDGELETVAPLRLTTPVSYLTTLFDDPFPNQEEEDEQARRPPLYWHIYPDSYLGVINDPDELFEWEETFYGSPRKQAQWLIWSHGPDGDGEDEGIAYDASNGTISNGDILRFGP